MILSDIFDATFNGWVKKMLDSSSPERIGYDKTLPNISSLEIDKILEDSLREGSSDREKLKRKLKIIFMRGSVLSKMASLDIQSEMSKWFKDLFDNR